MSLLISILFSSLVGLLIIHTKRYHEKFTADKIQGVQKFHTELTPRIGGIVILTGIIGGLGYEMRYGELQAILPIGLAIALFPVLFMGILEDFTKKIHANSRFVMAIISGVSFYAFLNVGITQTGLYWLDTYALSIPLISLLLTTVIIAGVSNATNIIDGFNGLLLGFSVMAAAGISWVSYQVGDQQILSMALILMGSIIGLIIFNFPKGKIFTGDGGAYMIGFLLSALTILLVNRNQQVSPWFPMLLLLYPITETIFSILRRVIIEKSSAFDADDKHLHTLLYRTISKNKEGLINHNAKTSLLIWPLMLCTIVPSMVFWNNTGTLMITNGLFLFGYYLVYRKLSILNGITSFGTSSQKQVNLIASSLVR